MTPILKFEALYTCRPLSPHQPPTHSVKGPTIGQFIALKGFNNVVTILFWFDDLYGVRCGSFSSFGVWARRLGQYADTPEMEGKYRYLTEIQTKLIEIWFSFERNTLERWKVNTYIWQKYGQSGWRCDFLLKEIHKFVNRNVEVEENIIFSWRKICVESEIEWKKSTEIYNNIDISAGNWYRARRIHVFEWNTEQTDMGA